MKSTQVKMNKIFDCKILNIFKPISFNIYILGAQRNHIIETVFLRTHYICLGLEMRKITLCYTYLNKGLRATCFCVFVDISGSDQSSQDQGLHWILI